MSEKLRSVLWTGGFLLALALVVYLLRPEGGQIAYDVKRSSFRTSPDGVAALYRAIDRLGRSVAPRMTPLVDADPIRGTVALLEPTDAPSPREVGALLAWVRDGGFLVYAPRYVEMLFDAEIPGSRSPHPLLDSLGLAVEPLPFVTEQDEDSARSGGAWAAHPLTRGLPRATAPVRVILPREFPSRPTTTLLRASARRGPAGSGRRQLADNPRDSVAGAVVAVVPLGAGRILAFADAAPLSNANAGDDPLAALAVRAAVAYTSPGDTVFFDEFHHGVHGLGSPASAAADFFFGSPRGRALFHLALVAFLAVAAAGVRLGAPADPPKDERRSPLEHVSALGALYRRAEARETAVLLLVSRLARWAHAPPPRDAAEAAALLDSLAGRAEGDGAAQLRRIRNALGASPPELIAVAAGIDEFTAGARRRRGRSNPTNPTDPTNRRKYRA